MTAPFVTHSTNHVEFDLHGLVGVRLENPSASDVAAVRRQLGPLESVLHRDPDIVIRFADRLTAPSTMRFLGADEAGFTDDAFWVLRSKNKSQARVMIPIQQIGNRCEIVCETGLSAVPLLIAIINLTALGNGAVPLHASGFQFQGTGVLATGWSKGGKTETLLSFMAHGAQYIADEWVYLHGDGRMSGIPEPIRVWDWHLKSMPQYLPRVSRGGRNRLRAIQLARLLLKLVPGGKWPLGQMKNRLAPFLKRQAYVDVSAERLFGRKQLLMTGELDKVLFVVSHETAETRVEPMSPDEIAERMVHSLQYEQAPFMGFYRMFRFAFPERANSLIDRTETLQRQLLSRALAGKDAYTVYHPYPVSLPALFQAISPLLAKSPPPPVHGNYALAGKGGGE